MGMFSLATRSALSQMSFGALLAGSSLSEFRVIAGQIDQGFRQQVPAEQIAQNITPAVKRLTVDQETLPDLVAINSQLSLITAGRIPVEEGHLENALRGVSRYITLFARDFRPADSAPSISRRPLSMPPRSVVKPAGKEDQLRCVYCNHWNPPEHKCCSECGNELIEEGALEIRPENRHGTILFTDMKGYTAATEGLTSEQKADFVNTQFRVLGNIVRKYGGLNLKTMGDALMAVFGAPYTYEDHAERAVRVALDMLHALQSLNRELKEKGLPEVKLRIGINSGEFLAALIGPPGAKRYDIIGTAVDIASRCESLKMKDTTWKTDFELPDENRIICSDNTLVGLGGIIDTKSLGPVPVKGAKDPVAMYLVLGENQKKAVIRARGEDAAQFRGREEELQKLHETFAEAAQGEPRMALVVAHAGQGKSRLATEFLKSVKDPEGREILRIETKGVDREAHPPYYYITEALKYATRIHPHDTDEDIEPKLQSLAQRVIEKGEKEREMTVHLLAYLMGHQLQNPPEEMEYLLKDATLLRERIHGVVVDLFKGLAKSQPSLLALEDMQWADQESLELVRRVMEEIEREQKEGTPHSLMVIGLARPKFTEKHPDFFKGDYLKDTIELGELSRESLKQIAADLLGDVIGEDDREEVQNFLVSQSGANPYVLHAMARAAREEGWLARDDETGTWQFQGPDGRAVPAGAESFLETRIRNLSPEEKEIIKIAAVLGDDISFETLRSLGVEDPGEVIQYLIAKEFLKRVGTTDRFEFRHAMIREKVMKMLIERDIKRLHLSVAEYYEREGVQNPAVIASHFERAWEDERAAEYYTKAAEADAKKGSFRTAAISYGNAYNLFGDPIQKGTALCGWSESLHFDRRYEEQLKLIDESDEILKMIPTQSRDIIAKIMSLKALALTNNGKYKDAKPEIERVLSLYSEAEVAETKCRALHIWGMIYWRYHNDNDMARDCFHRALEVARLIEDSYLIASSLNNLTMVEATVGDYSASYAHGYEAVRVNREAGNLRGLLYSINNTGSTLMTIGDYEGTAQLFEEGISVSSKHLNDHYLDRLYMNYGEVLRRVECLTDAISYLRKAVVLHSAHPNTPMSGLTHVYLSQSYRAAKDESAALREAKVALEIAREIGDRSLSAKSLMVKAQALLTMDRLEGAYEASSKSVEFLNKLGVVEEFDLEILLTHSKVLMKRGENAEAWKTIDRARRELNERAAKITDREHQKRFTSRVKVNVEILRQWELLKFVTTHQVKPVIREILSSLNYYTPKELPEDLRFVNPSRHYIDADAIEEVMQTYSLAEDREAMIRQLVENSMAIEDTKNYSRAGVIVSAPLSSLFTSLLTNDVEVERNDGDVRGVWAQNIKWQPFFDKNKRLHLLLEWKLNAIAALHHLVFPLVGQRKELKQLMKDSIYTRDGVVHVTLTEEPRNKITKHDGTVIRIPSHLRVERDKFGDIRFRLVKMGDDKTLVEFFLEKQQYTHNAHNFLRELLVSHFISRFQEVA